MNTLVGAKCILGYMTGSTSRRLVNTRSSAIQTGATDVGLKVTPLIYTRLASIPAERQTNKQTGSEEEVGRFSSSLNSSKGQQLAVHFAAKATELMSYRAEPLADIQRRKSTLFMKHLPDKRPTYLASRSTSPTIRSPSSSLIHIELRVNSACDR